MSDERDRGVRVGLPGDPTDDARSIATTAKGKYSKAIDRRTFMNYAGLGTLAGLSLVVLGGCDSGGGGGGTADGAQGGATNIPTVEKTVKKLVGISTYVVVKFTALLDTSKSCYRFIWNPIPSGDLEEEGFYNQSGVTYLSSKYTNWAAYAGKVTVKINTPDLGCGESKLLCDLFGTKVPPYTNTVTFA